MLRMFIIVLHVLGNDWKFILYIVKPLGIHSILGN